MSAGALKTPLEPKKRAVDRSSDLDAIDALAGRSATGDETAFARLHGALTGSVEGFFGRQLSGNRELAQELAHRTWVEAWRSLGRGRFDPSRSRFTTYLIGIAYKIWLRHLRSAGRDARRAGELERHLSPILERGEDDLEQSDELMDFLTRIDALRECVSQARNRRNLRPVDLRILDGLLAGRTERELAEDLKLARSTIHARKTVTLDILRRCLAGRGLHPERGEL